MTITEMKVLKDADANSKTRLYSAKIRLNGAQNSNAIAFPNKPILDIAFHQAGSALVYLTNYSYQEIENDTARWSLYDGSSEINKAVTAIKAENASGAEVIMITATVAI